MTNRGKFIVLNGAGGTNGPQGPSKLPTLKQFLSALSKSRFSLLKKLAVVYNLWR